MTGVALVALPVLPARAQSNYATPLFITTLAGGNSPGTNDGTGTGARVSGPCGVEMSAKAAETRLAADTIRTAIIFDQPGKGRDDYGRRDPAQHAVACIRDDDIAVAVNDNALGNVEAGGGSRDAALVQSLDGGLSIQARGTGAGTVLVEAYDVGTGNTPRLINVSARNRVGTGDGILIAGFNVTGTGTKQVLIRAVGPGLTGFGVPGTLADPRLDVFDSSNARIGENDNWPAALAPTFVSVGAFPLTAGSRDAALLTTLPVGSYTVQVRGADGGTGEAIVEVYEVP